MLVRLLFQVVQWGGVMMETEVKTRPLTTYNNIKRYVSVGNPGSSKLYTVFKREWGTSDATASTGGLLLPHRSCWFSKWIQQGALNNGCIDSNCDTTNVTYSGAIQIIMQTNCTGCHSATNASGGIKLDTYADVKSTITSGRLYGSIIQSSGFKPMPPGSKLTDCSIKKIKTWIDKGSLNN